MTACKSLPIIRNAIIWIDRENLTFRPRRPAYIDDLAVAWQECTDFSYWRRNGGLPHHIVLTVRIR